MGHPPECIFVVRHGNRLDAADKHWHLTSPAPYDPPLTFGGWQQAQKLGARIGTILRERIQEQEAAAARNPGGDGKRKRRKQQVILHCSPFLRCVQTAIGISAGIAQDPTPLQTPVSNGPRKVSDAVSNAQQRLRINTAALGPDKQSCEAARPHDSVKTVLRLDAFLGEWQNPDYYSLITPPPESVMMLATAKAELLRHEDHHASSFPPLAGHLHSNSQGQLWNGAPRSPLALHPGQADGFESLSTMMEALSRSSSMSSHSGKPSISLPSSEMRGYVAPQPHYAISSNAPIPAGYVAHSRDACVKIDYQWDSMRAPLEWGDGGSFPEEWPDMRERFRQGLQHLVNWYSSADNPTGMIAKMTRWRPSTLKSEDECAIEDDETEDDDTDAIIIIVTHGGGCNALIGALTEKPILENFRVTSLTMAVRKSDEELATVEVSSSRHKHSALTDGHFKSIPIPKYYDIKLVGDTEHLHRSNSASSQSSISSRTPSTSGPAAARGRFSSNPLSMALGNFTYHDVNGSRSTSGNPPVLKEQRLSNPSSGPPAATTTPRGTWAYPKGGITVGSGVTSFGTRNPMAGLSRTPSFGLWSPTPKDEEDEDPMMLLNFGYDMVQPPLDIKPNNAAGTASDVSAFAAANRGQKPEGQATESADISSVEETDGFDSVPSPGVRLWDGSPIPSNQSEPPRDLSTSKRRWTVNQMES